MLSKPVMSDRSVWRMRSWMSTPCTRQSFMVVTMTGTADWGTIRRPISLCKEPIEIATTLGLRVAQPMRTGRRRSSVWVPESILIYHSAKCYRRVTHLWLMLLPRRHCYCGESSTPFRRPIRQEKAENENNHWRLSDLPLLRLGVCGESRSRATTSVTCQRIVFDKISPLQLTVSSLTRNDIELISRWV